MHWFDINSLVVNKKFQLMVLGNIKSNEVVSMKVKNITINTTDYKFSWNQYRQKIIFHQSY